MLLENDKGKALTLVCLPVATDAHLLDLSEGSEPIADIVFLEVVREVFDKDGGAVLRHAVGDSGGVFLRRYGLPTSRRLDVKIPSSQILTREFQGLLLRLHRVELDVSKPTTLPAVLVAWQLDVNDV